MSTKQIMSADWVDTSTYTYCWHVSLSMKQIILNETKYAIGLIYGHCITLF